MSSLITDICMTHIVICWGVRIVTCCPHVLPWLPALHHIHTCFCDLTCVPYTFTNWQWILTAQNLPHAQTETHCVLVLPTLHTVSSSPDIFKLTAWCCNTYNILSWLYDQQWTVTRWHSHRIMVFHIGAAVTLFFWNNFMYWSKSTSNTSAILSTTET
jgi:hypothetical protein